MWETAWTIGGFTGQRLRLEVVRWRTDALGMAAVPGKGHLRAGVGRAFPRARLIGEVLWGEGG